MGLQSIADGARAWRDALRASPLDIPLNGEPLARALATSTLTLSKGAVTETSRHASPAELQAIRGVEELLSTLYPGVQANLTTISTSSTIDGFLALMAEAQVDDWARGSLRERAAIAREFHEVLKGQLGDPSASWGRITGWYLDETKQLALDPVASHHLLEAANSGRPATSAQMNAIEAAIHEGAHGDSPFRRVEQAGKTVPPWIEEGQAVLRARGNVHRAALQLTGAVPTSEPSALPTAQYQLFAALLERLGQDAGFELGTVAGRQAFHEALAESAQAGTMYGPWEMISGRVSQHKGAPQRAIREFLAATDGGPGALEQYLKISS